MNRYLSIAILMFFSSCASASWNEHFVKYTCLPELGVFQIERLSVESPDNFHDSKGVKKKAIEESLMNKNIYSISSGNHNFTCSIFNHKVDVDFVPKSYRHNWIGGKVSIKIGERYLIKDLDFFSSVPSLSKLKINFNSSSPFIYYSSNVSSENDIFGYEESEMRLSKDTVITYKDIVNKYKKSLQ
jgi:hypothetical protein